jgi:hypothetical protein
MNIEQRLAEAISSFSLDALAGAVPLNVDRTYSPILRQASLPDTIIVPWWKAAPSATTTTDPTGGQFA